MVNLDTTKEEAEEISAIVDRVIEYCHGEGGYVGPDRLTLEIDITACHMNGCPLRLKELRAARIADLEHDVMGIYSHINRKTGKLEGGFQPRYAGRL